MHVDLQCHQDRVQTGTGYSNQVKYVTYKGALMQNECQPAKCQVAKHAKHRWIRAIQNLPFVSQH